jgi:hypothetical protein
VARVIHQAQHVLVHNIGHHDVYFDLYERGAPAAEERVGWCKPKGRAILAVGALLHEALTAGDLHATPDPHGGYALSRALPLPEYTAEELTRADSSTPWQWGEPLNAQRTSEGLRARLQRPLEVRRLYLPLLHAVLTHHEQTLLNAPCALTLLLVTAGARGTENAQGRVVGADSSSPESLARCIALLARRRWEALALSARCDVRCCHANTDARKLDASALQVVEAPLRQLASALADLHGEGWRERLRVSLSASTGTSNMLSALTLTLSEWRPTLYTISKALQPLQCTPDAPNREYNPTESSMEAVSEWVRVGDARLDDLSRFAVDELRRWRADYLAQRPTRPKELQATDAEGCFFHRKGLKEVLCVVVVRDAEGREGPAGGLVAARGINLEVSLPTGTLCAERNAIGTALCRLPNLRRRDIRAVAVLSLDPSLRNLGPCGACQEWLKKVVEVNPDLRIISFGDVEATQVAVRPALTV